MKCIVTTWFMCICKMVGNPAAAVLQEALCCNDGDGVAYLSFKDVRA
jgi:hypothetical protein